MSRRAFWAAALLALFLFWFLVGALIVEVFW